QSRYRFGNLTQNDASRFLEELPLSFIDNSMAGNKVSRMTNLDNRIDRKPLSSGSFAKKSPTQSHGASTISKPITTSTSSSDYVHPVNPNFVASPPDTLQEGDKVEHQKFGFGQ